MNWLALSDQCSSKAKDLLEAGEFKDGKQWILTSIALYDFLSSQSLNENSIIDYEIAAIRLRITAINILGVNQDDELCSVRYIERWFQQRNKYPINVVVEKASNWTLLPKEEILYLRRIKNILSALELLNDLNYYSNEMEIEAWFDIKEKLP